MKKKILTSIRKAFDAEAIIKLKAHGIGAAFGLYSYFATENILASLMLFIFITGISSGILFWRHNKTLKNQIATDDGSYQNINEPGLHSISVYQGSGKAYEAYHLNSETHKHAGIR